MANVRAARRSPYCTWKGTEQLSLAEAFKAIISTTYSFSQPIPCPLERSAQVQALPHAHFIEMFPGTFGLCF